MGYFYMFLLLFVSWVLFIPSTHQLQTSEAQVLLQLRKHLEYPSPLEIWENYNGDLCSVVSTAHMRISCQDNSVTQLKIMGDKLGKVGEFRGFPIPNQTLSQGFSIDSFITTLTRLTSLRVLTLVSLGIWGPLPDKIHRLSSLEVLDLSSNFMFGSIPSGISRLVKLQTLTLDGNYFNETVPDWWNSLSNLTALSLKSNQLKENRLDSRLPVMPKGLVTALLSKNSFSGEIPQQFGELGQLQHLDLSFNNLSGTPPSALFSLTNLSYLHLASNMLSGSLPNHLNCGSKLGFVDISNNKLVGGLPPCLDSDSDKTVVKFGGNCLSVDDQHQHQESYCKEASTRKQSMGREVGFLIAIICGVVLTVVLAVVGALIFCRRYRKTVKFEQYTRPKAVQDNSPARGLISQVKLGTQGSPVYRSFSLEELKEATSNFHSSSFLGEGSRGKIPLKFFTSSDFQLYKGRLENGTYVAIRSLAFLKKYSIQNLKIRLDFLSKLHHPHLVGLLGHCIEGGGQDNSSASKVFLVYEYVPYGNYHTHLSENCPEKVLNWSDRLSVLIGVAKAVHFLHTGVIPGSFNNQLRTNNILLDEHRIAKLSDYGMTIIMEENERLEAKGDGSKSCQTTKVKDDVYNFGFILLESLVGPIVSGKGEAFLLKEMASFGSQDGRKRIVDPAVLTTCSQESLSIVVSITNKCISPEPSDRPSFEDVLWNLQYAAQVQASADTEQKSDSTS
ncbi:hypothetical protein Patl1_02991 [Pistacia atlantica]|uniref:Uncharacterized protein n=1 Tax=Pistacia atlantica TaxID=434234 RepID=A0ACC1C6D6_9ROSI|nr:hypothetical protein Patl1_02991 [Pistacia atlantica]